MTILNVDKDLPLLIRMVSDYLSTKTGLSVASLADQVSYSKSYIYRLRGNGDDISVDSRRSFLVRLLKTFSLSISKDDEGDYLIQPHANSSFYLLKYRSYLYDKDSKVLESYYVQFDVVAETLFFYLDERKRLFSGKYSHTSGVTNFTVKNDGYIEYFYPGDAETTESPEYDDSEDQEFNNEEEMHPNPSASFDCIINAEVPHYNEETAFGAFTKRTGNYKMSTGRIILTNYEFETITDDLICFLSNEKFHEFYNYETDIKTNLELNKLIEKFAEKYRFVNIEVPKEIATAYQQFLSFFTDYVSVIKGKDIKFDVIKNHDGLTVNLELISDNIQMDEVNIYLKEYLDFAGKQIDTLRINVESEISNEQFDIFLLRLEGQINHLKQEVKIANMNINFLEKSNGKLENENEFLRGVVQKFSDKQSTVLVQMLNGGSQQFADKIDNL